MKIIFFNSTIEKFLLSLEKSAYSKTLKQIKLLENLGYELGMPYSRQIDNNLYELRIRGRQEVRIFYCFYDRKVYILHVFIKKSQKIPRREINVAKRRISLLT